MMQDRAVAVIWLVGALVLVGRALIVRRNSRYAPGLRMALIWVAIFALLFGLAHWVDLRR